MRDDATSAAAQGYVRTLQAGGLSLQQAGAAINRSIDVEAHLLAANDLFLASSILFLLMIGIAANLFTSVWLSRSMFDFMVGRKAQTSLSI